MTSVTARPAANVDSRPPAVAALIALTVLTTATVGIAWFSGRTAGPLRGPVGPSLTGWLVLTVLVLAVVLAAPAAAAWGITRSLTVTVGAAAATVAIAAGGTVALAHSAQNDLQQGQLPFLATYAADLTGQSLHTSVLHLDPALGLPDGRYFVSSSGANDSLALTAADAYGSGRWTVVPRHTVLAEIRSDRPGCVATDVRTC